MDNPTPPNSILQQQALPTPTTNIIPVPIITRVPKHFLAAFFLSFFMGVFGADQFYLGRYVKGTLKLLTFGGFGISAIIDLAVIMNGAMHDSHDQPLVGYEEYKGLARKTVRWVTIGAVLFIVVNGVLILVAVEQFINQSHSSSITTSIENALSGNTASGSATGSSSSSSTDSSSDPLSQYGL